MNLTGTLMALICIAIVSSLSISMYANMQDTYDIDTPTSFQGVNLSLETFERSSQVVDLAERMEDNNTGIAKALRGIPIFGEIGAITLAGVQILTLILSTPAMFTSMISDTITIVGLPPQVGSLILAAMTIFIIMAIVSALVKWGGSN